MRAAWVKRGLRLRSALWVAFMMMPSCRMTWGRISDHPKNNALALNSKPELSKWYHASLFIPVKKTLLQAIKNGHFITWPNMTVELMKHLLPYKDTAKGHMQKVRRNIKSTNTQSTPPNTE